MKTKSVELNNLDATSSNNSMSSEQSATRAFDPATMQNNNGTFSIATPSVTNHVLPLNDNSNDSSFLPPVSSYQQQQQQQHVDLETNNTTTTSTSLTQNNPNLINLNEDNEHESNSLKMNASNQQTNNNYTNNINEQPEHPTMISSKLSSSDSDGPGMEGRDDDDDDVKTTARGVNNQCDTHLTTMRTSTEMSDTSGQDDGSKCIWGKKRSKASKKSAKLDPKSKLEKSRQSARECRARKKLRYQYLEDLVCNREKAVIKLREELSMFCDLSKQMDIGSISESNRRLLVDQIKENTKR